MLHRCSASRPTMGIWSLLSLSICASQCTQAQALFIYMLHTVYSISDIWRVRAVSSRTARLECYLVEEEHSRRGTPGGQRTRCKLLHKLQHPHIRLCDLHSHTRPISNTSSTGMETFLHVYKLAWHRPLAMTCLPLQTCYNNPCIHAGALAQQWKCTWRPAAQTKFLQSTGKTPCNTPRQCKQPWRWAPRTTM